MFHPDTNPAGEALTSVNLCLGKLSEAQSASLEANISRFPFIFFNLFIESHVFSGGIYQRHLQWHYNDTKTISCTITVLVYSCITQRKLESPKKQNAGQLTVMEKNIVSSYCTTTRTQCVPIFIISRILSIFPSNIPYPSNFLLNIPYLVVMNYHWEPSLPNTPGRSKLWEEKRI